MSPFENPEFAARCAGHPQDRCANRFGPPLPLKLVGVGAAFLLCRPLGLLALGAVLWSHCRRHGFPGHGPWQGLRHRRGFARSGNAAFDAAQREALSKLAADAEAFAEFRRQQREARDKEAFDRFQAEREAKPEAPQNPQAHD